MAPTTDLNDDCLLAIFKHLTVSERVRVRSVCVQWCRVIDGMWASLTCLEVAELFSHVSGFHLVSGEHAPPQEHLDEATVQDICLPVLARILSAAKSTLRVLDLRGVPKHLVGALQPYVTSTQCPVLSEMKFSDVSLDDVAPYLLPQLRGGCFNLTSLTVDFADSADSPSSDKLECLLEAHPRLVALDFGFHIRPTQGFKFSFLSGLPSTVKHLRLRCSLAEEAGRQYRLDALTDLTRRLAKKDIHLETLELSNYLSLDHENPNFFIFKHPFPLDKYLKLWEFGWTAMSSTLHRLKLEPVAEPLPAVCCTEMSELHSLSLVMTRTKESSVPMMLEIMGCHCRVDKSPRELSIQGLNQPYPLNPNSIVHCFDICHISSCSLHLQTLELVNLLISPSSLLAMCKKLKLPLTTLRIPLGTAKLTWCRAMFDSGAEKRNHSYPISARVILEMVRACPRLQLLDVSGRFGLDLRRLLSPLAALLQETRDPRLPPLTLVARSLESNQDIKFENDLPLPVDWNQDHCSSKLKIIM